MSLGEIREGWGEVGTMICRAVAMRQPYNGRIAATLQRGANETSTAIPFCRKRMR